MDRTGTLIVRPAALNDDKYGQVLVEFGNKGKGHTIDSNRSDATSWITNKMLVNKFGSERKIDLASLNHVSNITFESTYSVFNSTSSSSMPSLLIHLYVAAARSFTVS